MQGGQLEGGCRCGAVRYRLGIQTLPATYACHCRDCQTWTGSAFSQQFFLDENLLTVDGEVAIYELSPGSGRISRQRVCSVCHSRVYNTNSARPGLVIIRAGTLDRSDELEVVAHIWTRRKQQWIAIPGGVPCWSDAAPYSEIAAVMGLAAENSKQC